jgi:UDP-perosamine 4-acetyltransferase
MINLILIGKGRGIKEVIWIIDDINNGKKFINLLGIVADTNKPGILGNREWLIKNKNDLEKKNGEIFLIVCVGDPIIRKKLSEDLEKYFKFTNLIHPSARIHPSAKLGKGITVSSGCLISSDANIGDHVSLNFDVLVTHNVSIGKYCNCSPKTSIMGNVNIGELNFFGTGVFVIPDISIGNKNVIGAGSVVTRSFKDNNTIFGNPAKSILRK